MSARSEAGAWERVLMLTVHEVGTRRAALRMFPTVTEANLDTLAQLWNAQQGGAAWSLATDLVAAWKSAGSPRTRDTEMP
jgi:hypothetical protein